MPRRASSSVSSPMGSARARSASKSAVKVALPNVSVVPDSLKKSHFEPIRSWIQKFWLRGRIPPQTEVDTVVDLAAAVCIDNYTVQFRELVLKSHDTAFKILAAGAHRKWKCGGPVIEGSSGHLSGRELLAVARRDYVEAVRLLNVVFKVCNFHDSNHPRDSLAVALVALLKQHLLEKDNRIFLGLCDLLGNPKPKKHGSKGDSDKEIKSRSEAAAVAWAECFPDPTVKPVRIEASQARVAYNNGGERHWKAGSAHGESKAPMSPQANSPQHRGAKKKPLRTSEAVVVSSGGGTLVTTTETKNVCLPLLGEQVPVVPDEEDEGTAGKDGDDQGTGKSHTNGTESTEQPTSEPRKAIISGSDRAHIRLASAENVLGETVTPFRENRSMHAELRYSEAAAEAVLEDGERTVERLQEAIDDLAEKILDVQTGTGIGDVRHWSQERLERLQQLLALRAQKQAQLEAAEKHTATIDGLQEQREQNLDNIEYKLTALHGTLRRSKKDRAFNFFKWRRRRNPDAFPDQVQQKLAAVREQPLYTPPQKTYNHFEDVQRAKEEALRQRRKELGILAADGEQDDEFEQIEVPISEEQKATIDQSEGVGPNAHEESHADLAVSAQSADDSNGEGQEKTRDVSSETVTGSRHSGDEPIEESVAGESAEHFPETPVGAVSSTKEAGAPPSPSATLATKAEAESPNAPDRDLTVTQTTGKPAAQNAEPVSLDNAPPSARTAEGSASAPPGINELAPARAGSPQQSSCAAAAAAVVVDENDVIEGFNDVIESDEGREEEAEEEEEGSESSDSFDARFL